MRARFTSSSELKKAFLLPRAQKSQPIRGDDLIHKSAELLIIRVELLVEQHVEQHAERARLPRAGRSLDEREVGGGPRGRLLRHGAVQRGLHREQLRPVEAPAEVVHEDGRAAVPRELSGEGGLRGCGDAERGAGVVQRVAQQRRVLARVDAAVQPRTRPHHLAEQRVQRQAERREGGRVDRGAERVVHVAVLKGERRVRETQRAQLGEEGTPTGTAGQRGRRGKRGTWE